MNPLVPWLTAHVPDASVPLFLTDEALVVETWVHQGLPKLRRHPAFDTRMIDLVEAGCQRESWQGLVYLMHWWRHDQIIPLYIGKAERRGVKHPLSVNLVNIRRNQHKFGRWGYGLAYHIGDLSQALLGGDGYRRSLPKYHRWAAQLFRQATPPTLREPVFVALLSWDAGMCGPSGLPGAVPAVEKELIALASVLFPEVLLNRDGT